MPANDRMPRSWSRRSLLVAFAAGSVTALSVTALSGCQVQLEEGAPGIPLVPTRVPMKDEKALLAVLARTTSLGLLATAAGGASTSIPGRLSAVHATQVGVITRLLRDGGVPQSLFSASATPSPTSPATAATPNAAVLSAAESNSVGDVSLASLSNAHVPLIGSMLAQRIAAARLLGERAAPFVLSGLDGAEAVRLLEAARAAVYGFEVVAAQIGSTGRALAMPSLASLRSRAAELETLVGSPGTPPSLGYQLPFSVTDSDSARRLARHLLEALLATHASALEPATGDATALATLVQWLGATEAIASRWGAPMRAFPGLTNG